MPSNLHELKRKLKFAPKMGREMRAEYLLVEVKAGPRTLTPATVAKLRAELTRLAASPDARVRKFVKAMASRYPEVTA
jgi:hypothetical protein